MLGEEQRQEYHHQQQHSIKEEENDDDEPLNLIHNLQPDEVISGSNPHGGLSFKCKEEEEEIIVAAEQEYERLTDIEEQKCLAKIEEQKRKFLEMERRAQNEIKQDDDDDQEDDYDSTEEAVTATDNEEEEKVNNVEQDDGDKEMEDSTEEAVTATDNEEDEEMVTGKKDEEEMEDRLTGDNRLPHERSQTEASFETRKEPRYNLRSRKSNASEEERAPSPTNNEEDENEDQDQDDEMSEEEFDDESESESESEDDYEEELTGNSHHRKRSRRPRTEARKQQSVNRKKQRLQKSNVVQRKRYTLKERIDQLRAYKKQYGTANVLKKNDKPLYDWLIIQKGKLRKGTLSNACTVAFDELEVDLKPYRNQPKKKSYTYEESINQLREYRDQHGTVNVSRKNDPRLSQWLNKQKLKHRNGMLSKKWTQDLEELGVNLNTASKKCDFDERFNQLKEHKEKYGSAHVPKSVNETLYSWAKRQKWKYKEGSLPEEHTSMLRKIGVDLESGRVVHTFSTRIKELREYKEQHGTVIVSVKIDELLYKWLLIIRLKYRQGKLSKEHTLELEELGVDLKSYRNTKKQTFEQRLHKLREYKDEHGTANVSQDANGALYKWLNKQKVAYREGSLSNEHASVLKKEGVDLTIPKVLKFEERLDQAKKYKEKYGHLENTYHNDNQLYEWLKRQRTKLRNGTLSHKYASILEEEGVELPRTRSEKKHASILKEEAVELPCSTRSERNQRGTRRSSRRKSNT